LLNLNTGTGALSSSSKDGYPGKITGKAKKKPDSKKLKKMLQKELKRFSGTIGLILYDFDNGYHVEIKPDQVFESASLVKIPIMIEVYRRISEGSLLPSKEIELSDSHRAGGSGILKKEPAGSRWRVDKLVELMITESDNTATDMLLEMVTMEKAEKTIGKLGIKNTTIRRKIFDFAQIDKGKDNLTTPGDMFRMFRILYESRKIGEKQRAEMLNILKNQKRNRMIPRFLPGEVQCAHKTGSLLGILHDCGIIYPKNKKPYILIIMGKNIKNQKICKKRIAALSRKIYDFLQNNKD